MSVMHTQESIPTTSARGTLPRWPGRTIAVLTTVSDDGVPHAIPVSGPVRAGDHRILLNLHRTRDSLRRLRTRPQAAITILAATNVAFTARGEAQVIQEPMAAGAEYAAVALDVTHVDDHRQPGFEVEAGVDRRWLDAHERDSLGQRVRELTALAANA